MDNIDFEIEKNSGSSYLKFDDNEQALFDDLALEKETEGHISKRRRPNPKPRRPEMKRRTQPMHREEVLDDDIDAFINADKQHESRDYGIEEEEPIDHGEEYSDGGEGGEFGEGRGGYSEEAPGEGYKSVDEEKADLLNRLARLKKKGHSVNRQLNAYSSVSDLRTEYSRIKYSIDAEGAIKTARKVLIAGTSGIEMLNKKFNPFDLQLDGWSESIMQNADDYDPVFEELYNKYKTSVSVSPEIRLLMMLGGSAFMFHLTNSLFKSAMPNIGQVVKQNPDLVQSMMNAVQNTTMPSVPVDPTNEPVNLGNRREMNGPGMNFDLGSLMGNLNQPPPPMMNTQREQEGIINPVSHDEGNMTMEELKNIVQGDGESVDYDDISDIVSIEGGGELKDVGELKTKKTRTRRKKKTKEISL